MMGTIIVIIVGLLLILYCHRSFDTLPQRLFSYGLTLCGVFLTILYFYGYVGVGIPGLLLELFGKVGFLQ